MSCETRWTICRPTANRRNSPPDAMLIAMNQGASGSPDRSVHAASAAASRRAVRQPQHQATSARCRSDQAPARPGPWSGSPGSGTAQNSPASQRDGRFPSSHRQNWQPKSKQRQGRVGRRQLRFGDHDRRRRQDQAGQPALRARTSAGPARVTPSTVAAPATAETSRAPKGLSPPSAVPSPISQ